jgi:hypothetical protein
MMQLLQIDRVEDEMIWTVINMRWVGLLFLLPRMETSSFSGPKPGVPSGAPRECYSKPRFHTCPELTNLIILNCYCCDWYIELYSIFI